MLELIAVLTMTIDHIGYVFFPEEPIFRIIGRIALPLYIWGVVEGYKHTRSKVNYVNRLFLLAVISQLPYMLLFHLFHLNVVFTLMFCLLFIIVLESGIILVVKITIFLTLFILVEMYCEYGAYAILMTLIFHAVQSKVRVILLFAIINILFMLIHGNFFQLFSIFSLLIIFNKELLPNVRVNRQFHRLFYPVHLSLLFIIFIWIT